MDDSIPIGELTKPSSFQVLGEEGTEIVRAIRRLTGLPGVAEITDPRPIETLTDLVAMIRDRARNTHDDPLLKELAPIRKPAPLGPSSAARLEGRPEGSQRGRAAGDARPVLHEARP